VCVARQSLTRTWRRIGSYLAESCESGCCVHVVYVPFPALRLLHVFAVRLVECYSSDLHRIPGETRSLRTCCIDTLPCEEAR